jgi:hypothetical protein
MRRFLHDASNEERKRRSLCRCSAHMPTNGFCSGNIDHGVLSKHPNEHGEKHDVAKNQSSHFRRVHSIFPEVFRQKHSRHRSVATGINVLVARAAARGLKPQHGTVSDVKAILGAHGIGFWNSKVGTMTHGSFSVHRGGKPKIVRSVVRTGGRSCPSLPSFHKGLAAEDGCAVRLAALEFDISRRQRTIRVPMPSRSAPQSHCCKVEDVARHADTTAWLASVTGSLRRRR